MRTSAGCSQKATKSIVIDVSSCSATVNAAVILQTETGNNSELNDRTGAAASPQKTSTLSTTAHNGGDGKLDNMGGGRSHASFGITQRDVSGKVSCSVECLSYETQP